MRENKTIKISNYKYINEVLKRYESQHGELRKEKIPIVNKDHPELDDTELLDDDGRRQYQSNIGIAQWIDTAGRMDIVFAVSSLSRFNANPRHGHLKRTIKLFGFLKKYPKRGYIVDPRPPKVNVEYNEIIPDFGNQYPEFQEEIDDKLPIALMKELQTTIFVDADHGHDKVTGRSITGIIVLVGRTPICYAAKRQGAVQTATFGAEFVGLKKAVEEAVTMRYYLRSMGVKISKPTIIYGDNLSSITNVINPGSQLKKKFLALSYHFCREHFSAGIVSIRKIDGKDNFADIFDKILPSHSYLIYQL